MATQRFFAAFLPYLAGQHFGQPPGPRHLWPREQDFQPLDVLAMEREADATG